MGRGSIGLAISKSRVTGVIAHQLIQHTVLLRTVVLKGFMEALDAFLEALVDTGVTVTRKNLMMMNGMIHYIMMTMMMMTMMACGIAL